MKPNKKIDRLFQEKLKDLEVAPPDIVWQNIEARLNGKKKRRLIPIWFRFAGAAAILLLLTFGTLNYLEDPINISKPEHTISDTENNEPILDPKNKKDLIIIEDEISNIEDISNSIVTTDKPNKKTSIEIVNSSTQKKSEDPIIKQLSNETLLVANKNKFEKDHSKNNKNTIVQPNLKESKNENIVSEDLDLLSKNENRDLNNTTPNESTAVSNKKETESEEAISYQHVENLEDTLEDKLTEDLKEDSKGLNMRWTIASVFAPVYYNSFNSKGSPLDSKFENNSKEGSQSVAYGMKIGYQLSKKLSLQSGVTLINVGYSINNIYVNPIAQSSSRLTNLSYTESSNVLILNVSDKFNQDRLETINSQQPISGDLNQEYGYIEIPMELKYSLINGKIGVHLVAGFSTLFLNSNNVTVKTDLFSSDLGEAQNLNEINFSGNFGLDLDYKINNRFFINVAPMLKVHTSTFSENSKNFNPYIIGVYTGINYRY